MSHVPQGQNPRVCEARTRGRKNIDEGHRECKNTYMAGKRISGSMTDLLRRALNAAPSLNAVEKATGVKRQSLALFMRGEQPSLRSEAADKLASYFQIECSMPAAAAIKKERKNG
jgi:hypothetical protein